MQRQLFLLSQNTYKAGIVLIGVALFSIMLCLALSIYPNSLVVNDSILQQKIGGVNNALSLVQPDSDCANKNNGIHYPTVSPSIICLDKTY